MTRPREGLLIAAFAAIAVLVGGNAVGIRFSNRELDPLWGAGLRFALAATLLVAAMAVLRLKLPRGRALTGALLFGPSTLAAPSPSAIARSSNYTPGSVRPPCARAVETLLLAVLQVQERLRVVAVARALVPLVGVALMSHAPLRESLPLLSLLAAGQCVMHRSSDGARTPVPACPPGGDDRWGGGA